MGQWKYIIKSDLTSACYEIPDGKQSMKHCEIITPYKGVRVYTRCAMDMPDSKTALVEVTFGILAQRTGIVA